MSSGDLIIRALEFYTSYEINERKNEVPQIQHKTPCIESKEDKTAQKRKINQRREPINLYPEFTNLKTQISTNSQKPESKRPKIYTDHQTPNQLPPKPTFKFPHFNQIVQKHIKKP